MLSLFGYYYLSERQICPLQSHHTSAERNPQDPVASDDPDLRLVDVYRSMWRVCKLKRMCIPPLVAVAVAIPIPVLPLIPRADIQKLFALHFVAKIAWQAHDAASSLKLVEKGLPKEDFAVAALIDFPIQITAGWLAARWSVGDKPLRPWMYAWWVRAGFAALAMVVVSTFRPPVTWGWMSIVIVFVVLAGFSRYAPGDIIPIPSLF